MKNYGTQLPEVVVFSRSNDGHRGEYIDVLKRLFRCRVSDSLWVLISSPTPVAFLMIEEAFVQYVFVTLIRAAFGRRTVGLLFRPRPVVESSRGRHRFKRLTLQMLLCVRESATLTIVPFSVDPRFASIAKSWIYDPQLWDLETEERTNISAVAMGRLHPERLPLIAKKIVDSAAGRVIVGAIGRQTTEKGFDIFADMFRASSRIRARYAFACAGMVDANLRKSVGEFIRHGGVVIDRRISRDELLAVYGAVDLVWASYHRDYDQASGIFGRAVQLGIPVIVREDSLLHRLCIVEGLAHLAVTSTDAGPLLAYMPERDAARGAQLSETFRKSSVQRLNHALNISDAADL